MKTLGKQQFIDDFLQGQKDCQAGIKHRAHMGSAYDRGYMAEYEREQVLSELSRRRFRK